MMGSRSALLLPLVLVTLPLSSGCLRFRLRPTTPGFIRVSLKKSPARQARALSIVC